ncbi:MAG: hypothetical protein IKR19_07515 [Acholeplasmatales bacterium]|nr:hypothetical protein [Acholeplasmatales bacterium]
MKYLRATFKGYIGFYSGLGLEVVDIDFTKSTHNIILITGINGCGKSTLINSLNIFPDGSSSFIPGKNAEKTLILTDGVNIYEIHIISQADDKGGRKTTKAYIRKNGAELNETGNVSSYKDIIYSEFELDSNYVSLSSLSSSDRGLGDKTPAERKRFAANIIDNLEVYNRMYKTLNKKSLVYKSQLNNLHTKIQNIGRKNDLENILTNLKKKESSINDKIVEINNTIVAIQVKTSMDENELAIINDANRKINEYNSIISGIKSRIDTYQNKTHIKPEDIAAKYETDKGLLDQYNNNLVVVKSKWKDRYDRLNTISDSIQTIKTENISFDVNDDIGQKYTDSKAKLAKLESIIDISIREDSNSIYELSNLSNLYDRLIVLIDDFYDNLDDKSIHLLVTQYSSEYKSRLDNEYANIETRYNTISKEIADIQGQMKVLAILENRPSKCKIDSCPFISDAIQLKKNITGDIAELLQQKEAKLITVSSNLSDINEKIQIYNSLFPKYMKLDGIRRVILENESLISKYNSTFLSNFEERLSLVNPFNDIRDHQNIIDLINSLKIYYNELDQNKLLEVEYKSYQEKIKILNSNKAMMERLLKEQEEVNTEIASLKSEMDNYQSLIDTIGGSISIETEYLATVDNLVEPSNELIRYTNIIEESKKKSALAIESLSQIEEYKSQINNLTNELKPIVEQINSIAGQLTLLDAYYKEYDECKRNCDIIETVKKYCSPTGSGIQVLFMQLYMSKTLELSNRVLAMLFGGEYRLLDFVINENEFRIPFIGSGLPVDDISSGSSSQISIMGMIINLVLLHQASTRFNIARLDEIDAGLDNKNRSDFINFIFYTMDMLQIEQVFMISHSIEADNSNADIIKLKTYDDYESGIKSGNVIYDYSEHI